MTDEQLDELAALAQRIVSESGNDLAFDARSWVKRWANSPNAALGGKPTDFIDRPGGFELISTLLARTQSGAYS